MRRENSTRVVRCGPNPAAFGISRPWSHTGTFRSIVHACTIALVLEGFPTPLLGRQGRSISAFRVWPSRLTVMIWSGVLVPANGAACCFRRCGLPTTADGPMRGTGSIGLWPAHIVEAFIAACFVSCVDSRIRRFRRMDPSPDKIAVADVRAVTSAAGAGRRRPLLGVARRGNF